MIYIQAALKYTRCVNISICKYIYMYMNMYVYMDKFI